MRKLNPSGKSVPFAIVIVALLTILVHPFAASAAPGNTTTAHTMIMTNTAANASRVLRPHFGNGSLNVGNGNVTITTFSGDIIVGTCSFGTVVVQGSGSITTTPGVSVFHVSGSNADGWVLDQSDIYVQNGVSVGTFHFYNTELGADIRIRFVSTNGVDLNFSEGDC